MREKLKLWWRQLTCKHVFESDAKFADFDYVENDVCIKCGKLCPPCMSNHIV